MTVAEHPEFVSVRWDDLVAVLDDPDSPARHELDADMRDAYRQWRNEQPAPIDSAPTCGWDDSADRQVWPEATT